MARYYSTRTARSRGTRRTYPSTRRLQPYLSRGSGYVITKYIEHTERACCFSNAFGVDVAPLNTGNNISGQLLNLIPTADGIYGRIGNRVFMKSLLLRGHVYLNTNGAGRPNGADIVSADPLQHGSMYLVYAPAATTQATIHAMTEFLDAPITPFSLPSLDDFHELQILWKRQFKLSWASAGGATGTPGPSQTVFYMEGPETEIAFDYEIPLNLPVTFDQNPATNPTIATLRTGGLFLYFVSAHAPPPTYAGMRNLRNPGVTFSSRISFIEG